MAKDDKPENKTEALPKVGEQPHTQNMTEAQITEARMKRRAARRRKAIATGFVVGFLAAALVAVAILAIPGVNLVGAGGITAFIHANVTADVLVSCAGILAGFLGGKVGSSVMTNRFHKEEAIVGGNPAKTFLDVGKATLEDIKDNVQTLENVIHGREGKVAQQIVRDKAQDGKYTQLVSQQRADGAAVTVGTRH